MIARTDIITALHRALESSPHVHAAWLGGSDATGRTDDLSDIDLLALTDDDRVEETMSLVTRTLESLSPIAATYRVPEPAWHGHSQVFIRLEQASPFHLIDLCAMKRSSESRFLEPERHGKAVVLFDRDGSLAPVPFDRAAHDQRVTARLADLRARFTLFSPFAEKAVRRGDAPEAVHFYSNMTLRMLIDLLRIRYCPDRFDFGPRYLRDDLPAEWFETISRLALAGSLETIAAHNREAQNLFEQVLVELDARSGSEANVAASDTPTNA